MLFEGQGLVESHRHHSHMAGLYPFDVIDVDDGEKRNAVRAAYNTWVRRGTGLWSGWCVPWASILHTHADNASAAAFMIRAWDEFFCDPGHGSRHDAYRPGFSVMRGGPSALLGIRPEDAGGRAVMQMDGQCGAATAVLEMMAHDVNGKVEFFRGCPASWKTVSFENVRLSDGRRASGVRDNGRATVRFD